MTRVIGIRFASYEDDFEWSGMSSKIVKLFSVRLVTALHHGIDTDHIEIVSRRKQLLWPLQFNYLPRIT